MKKFLSKHLQASSGLFQTALTIGGNLAGTAMSALALILISRLLGPEKFGMFSVGFAISLILVRINEAGLNNVILKFASSSTKQTEMNAIFGSTLRFKLILSTVIAIIGLLLYRGLAELINFSQPLIILLAFTAGLCTVYFEHLLTILQSRHLFLQAVIANALQAVTKLGGALIFYALANSQTSLIYVLYVLAPATPLILAKWLLPSWIKLMTRLNSPQLKKKVISLAQHSAVALIAAGLIENIDVLFVQKYLTSYETGLYSGVGRIAMLFAMAAYSLGNVLNPRVARYKTRAHLSAYLQKAFLMVSLAVVGFILFLPFTKLLILLTIGPEYLSGTGVLIILTAASFLTIATIPFMALFYSLDADWYFSVSGILQLVIVIGGNLLFVPSYGLVAAAWTRLVSRVILFIFTLGVSLFLYRKHYLVSQKNITS